MCVRLRGDQRTDQLMNAAFHGTVEEQEHCARGLVDTDLNGDAGFLELARQIWQGLIEGSSELSVGDRVLVGGCG